MTILQVCANLSSVDLTGKAVVSWIEEYKETVPVKEGIFYLRGANIYEGEKILQSKLQKLAMSNKAGISYGFVTMGRAGAKGVKMPGHMFAYFSTKNMTIFIDPQLLDGELKKGKPIFKELRASYKLVALNEKTDLNTFGQYVFYAPVN